MNAVYSSDCTDFRKWQLLSKVLYTLLSKNTRHGEFVKLEGRKLDVPEAAVASDPSSTSTKSQSVVLYKCRKCRYSTSIIIKWLYIDSCINFFYSGGFSLLKMLC